jgi:hypothetical protein
MANSYAANDSITGYITNVSNENKKKKHFVKFTMSSENNQIVDGWIFSSIGGILTTPLGIALTHALKNKTGVKLWGSLEQNNGKFNVLYHVCIFIQTSIHLQKNNLSNPK